MPHQVTLVAGALGRGVLLSAADEVSWHSADYATSLRLPAGAPGSVVDIGADVGRLIDLRLAYEAASPSSTPQPLLGVGLVTGLVVFTGLLTLRPDAPTLWAGLTGRALPPVLVAFVAGLAGLAGLATLGLLLVRCYALARLTAVVALAPWLAGGASVSCRGCSWTRLLGRLRPRPRPGAAPAGLSAPADPVEQWSRATH